MARVLSLSLLAIVVALSLGGCADSRHKCKSVCHDCCCCKDCCCKDKDCKK
jgi:hypothetical protein